jgi:hypothetical protein
MISHQENIASPANSGFCVESVDTTARVTIGVYYKRLQYHRSLLQAFC